MKFKFTNLFVLLLMSPLMRAQSDTLTLTLQEAIVMAQERSSDARVAKHTFLAAEWNYKYYKANYLPTLTLTSNPSLNRIISKITLPDGSG